MSAAKGREGKGGGRELVRVRVRDRVRATTSQFG